MKLKIINNHNEWHQFIYLIDGNNEYDLNDYDGDIVEDDHVIIGSIEYKLELTKEWEHFYNPSGDVHIYKLVPYRHSEVHSLTDVLNKVKNK